MKGRIFIKERIEICPYCNTVCDPEKEDCGWVKSKRGTVTLFHTNCAKKNKKDTD